MGRLALIFLLFSFSLLAAQNGLVVVDKAVIYADVHMKHPIGYISKWKSVRVGNIARNGGTVLPVAVSKNKIGYISVYDLSFGRDAKSIQSTYDRFYEDAIRKKPKKDHFHIISNGFLGTAEIGDENFGTNTVDTYFFGFGFEKINFYSANLSWYWGLNYEVSQAGDGVELSNTMFRIGGKYKLFRYKDFTIAANANVGGSPYTAIETEYFRANGINFSTSGGLEVYVPLTSTMDFTVFGGYEIQKIIGLDLPAGLGEFNPFILGFKTNIGLAFYY
jgi:hypothetical protein